MHSFIHRFYIIFYLKILYQFMFFVILSINIFSYYPGLELLKFILLVSDITHDGVLGYSNADLARALYKWLLVLGLNFLSLFSFVMVPLVMANLLVICVLKPVRPRVNPSMLALFAKFICLWSIIIRSALIFEIDNILNLFLFVWIFHRRSYSLTLSISLVVLRVNILLEGPIYSTTCIMSSANNTSVPPAPGGGRSDVLKYIKCR